MLRTISAICILAAAMPAVSAASPVGISFDAGAPTTPNPRLYEKCLGSGHATLTLREDWRAQLATAERRLTAADVVRQEFEHQCDALKRDRAQLEEQLAKATADHQEAVRRLSSAGSGQPSMGHRSWERLALGGPPTGR